ncbi:MAG TPA: pyrroline-5-carboxylate reductase [Clostridiales bacterium]|nr:pyrroline-5-carboxylate reductase [Clostridiales bacterium]
MKSVKLGFIGCGNMATAIIKGLIAQSVIPRDDIRVFDIDPKKTKKIAEYGVTISGDLFKLLDDTNIIMLCVKSNSCEEVLNGIKDYMDENKVLVSIVAGISIEYLASFFKGNVKIVRTMPNTPALIGCGMTGVSFNEHVSDEEKKTVKQIFSSIGRVEVIDEELMDVVTAVSGSSPAYTYMYIEALADGAVLGGMPRDKAYIFAAQAVIGAAKMVLELKEHPGKLKDMVCSPAGTTIEAVKTLEEGGFRSTIINAVKNCYEKSKRMGEPR